MPELNLPERIRFYQHRKILRGDFLGDWDLSGNVYIHKDLEVSDKLGVALHEVIELLITHYFGIPDCCSPGYHQTPHEDLNEKAHAIAEEAELLVLRRLGINPDEYNKRIRKLRIDTYGDQREPCKVCYKRKSCKQKDAI